MNIAMAEISKNEIIINTPLTKGTPALQKSRLPYSPSVSKISKIISSVTLATIILAVAFCRWSTSAADSLCILCVPILIATRAF